ncbi:MAG: hypothetical protein CM15mP120_22970 [Pseudomonadota bacterium]|nr:MAG: hypothetical protein CM15mP120_22970 [Pseudomonadota bacterium]
MGTLGALFGVAYQSLRYRSGGFMLAIAPVAISVFVLLSVEQGGMKLDLVLPVPCRTSTNRGCQDGEINLCCYRFFALVHRPNVAWEPG